MTESDRLLAALMHDDAEDRRVDCRECHTPMTRYSALLGRGLCVECEAKAKEES